MGSSRKRIHLLCEDTNHERLLRKVLEKRFGIGPRQVFVDAAPRGEGDASKRVQNQFVGVLKDHRSKRSKSLPSHRVVVVIDGDKHGVDTRLKTLDSLLRDAKEPALSNADRVAVLVPTYSVETWLLWLSDERDNVDEATDCKNRFRSVETSGKASVEKAATALAMAADPTDLPSIAKARVELKLVGSDD